MTDNEKILQIAKQKNRVTTRDVSDSFSVSRQYANFLITKLIMEQKLIKVGSTRNAFYVLPEYAKIHPGLISSRFTKTLANKNIEEHKVLIGIENSFPRLLKLPENIRSIFTYAFSEMLNNAIEHSKSAKIKIEVSIQKKLLSFVVEDSGIGVFRNIMEKRGLKSELEAIQDLLKGKTTTMPKAHSGEGIFFTSKVGDLFILDSFGWQMIVDNKIPDVFVKKIKGYKRGTRVMFQLETSSRFHLNDVFKEFTNQKSGDYGFDKTEIRVKLFTMGGVHISRSQARRVLAGLEKFKIIVLDFEKVPVVGQAFADEIFRVFQNRHPNISIETENMDEAVRFMVNRAKSEAKK